MEIRKGHGLAWESVLSAPAGSHRLRRVSGFEGAGKLQPFDLAADGSAKGAKG